MSKKVRIGLLDSDPDIRYGRRMILSSESNYEIVLDSDGGTFDLGLVAESLIDVLVLDQRLGSGPGIDFYSKLRTLTGLKQAPTAVLTASYKQTALELEALEHGVLATISLETGAEGLLEATAFAAEGKAPLSLLDVFQLITSQPVRVLVDLPFLALVEQLPEKLSSNLRRLRSVWQKGEPKKLESFDLGALAGLVSRLPVKTAPELISRLHRSGLLDVK
jgi:DNA-binding NarL/FixJ family response regulator